MAQLVLNRLANFVVMRALLLGHLKKLLAGLATLRKRFAVKCFSGLGIHLINQFLDFISGLVQQAISVGYRKLVGTQVVSASSELQLSNASEY